jgi:MurNAc alpha-1-phosphate uridylyltransferase
VKIAPQTAFVLAAGLGTRMRPLTNDRPKALVEVASKALIDHMLEKLAEVGVKRFVVNVHYCADRLEAHLNTLPYEIVISDERDQLLETGGGLKKARSLLGNEPIFVANTDSLWLEDEPFGAGLEGLIRLYHDKPMMAALMVAPMTRSHGFDADGDFFINDAAQLRFRGEASEAPLNFTGVHICHPDCVSGVPETVFSLSRLWREAASEGRLYGHELKGEWLHVGDPQSRDLAQAAFQKKANRAP